MPAASTYKLSVQVLDFESLGLLIRLARLYAISVRRASVLPTASFRFHLAMDTLAAQLMVPPVGSIGDFHSQVRAPCRAHQKKEPAKLPALSLKDERDIGFGFLDLRVDRGVLLI